jgi:hypothetical protein
MSPPMPVLPGSVTFSPAATATAASAQLPPRWRIASPQAAARGCVLAMMPRVLWTTERREGKGVRGVGVGVGEGGWGVRGIFCFFSSSFLSVVVVVGFF